MSAISEANIRLCGSHAGVEIGADGPSQMALEDLATMRAVHGSTVLYPSDATSTASLTQQMADRDGVVYMRTTRGSYPVIYGPARTSRRRLQRGQAQRGDQVTLIGAGVTLHECLAAADELAAEGITARVIDLYSVKPVDTGTLIAPSPTPPAAWSWPKTTIPKAGSGLPCSRRWPITPSRTASPTWPSVACLRDARRAPRRRRDSARDVVHAARELLGS